MKSVKIAGTLIIVFVLGCTAVPVSTGNKGLETGDIGFQPHDMGTAAAGRDLATSLSFVGGNIGLTLISLALCGVAYSAVIKV
ncbi:MAG: hypothetical protein WC455_27415 [Dehalococcoidia bacterium]|jgi:hypothetical protein